MTDDLVKRLRDGQCVDSIDTWNMLQEAADRIEALERHIELRDWFLVETNLWEKFAKGAEGKK